MRAGRTLLGAWVVAAMLGAAPAARALDATLFGRPLGVGGHAEIRQVVKVDGSTPGDDTLQQLWLDLRYDAADWLRFTSSFSGQNGGPTTRSDSWGVYDLDHVFQSISPSLDFQEAYLDLLAETGDLRVGLQKMSWGKLDGTQPTDVLNTARYNDPFLLDEDERKIAAPAVQGSYYLPERDWLSTEGRLTLVWIPKYVPFRFPRDRERWFPPAAVPPDSFRIPAGVFPLPGGGDNPEIVVPLGFRTRNRSSPSFRMDRAGYGARLSGFDRGIDYAVYYYHGFDSQPAFRLIAEALAGEPSDGPLGFNLEADTELSPIFRLVHLGGIDAAYAWDRFTFRGEAAFVSGRPFSRDLRFLITDPRELAGEIRDAISQLEPGGPPVPIELPPSFVVRDAVEWGVGADCTIGGTFILLQVNQTDVLGNDIDLLIRDVETRLAANVRRRFWHEDLELRLSAVHAIESDYTMLEPRLTVLLWDRIELRAGYLFIAGRQSSLIGQYKQNDQAFFRLRYLF
jgi:hypothetical protein